MNGKFFSIKIYSFLSIAMGCYVLNAQEFNPTFRLLPSEKVKFNSFVDCNMAEAWVGDSLRIFPGKYGEDPVWGLAVDMKYASGKNADEVFKNTSDKFHDPIMPKNVLAWEKGLHGAVWFETIYQDTKDKTGKTLFGIYHNENYPQTFRYDSKNGQGYQNKNWPQGLRGSKSAAAVCRIGIMKSTDGGKIWEDKGILIEDLNSRMILKPHNTSNTFAGGVGDPSAVASGDYLYLFYGEYGYPGIYDPKTYDPKREWSGQCISVARIAIKDLEKPVGKAKRWDGKGFNAPYNGIGKPISNLQIQINEGGGPSSSPQGGFYWGPSVSWNTYLNCWVMMMGKVVGKSWVGSQVYISFNKNKDLGIALQSQEWTTPKLFFEKPGYTLWYPSLQPLNTEEDISNKYTCTKLGKRARFFVKKMGNGVDEYASEYMVEFSK